MDKPGSLLDELRTVNLLRGAETHVLRVTQARFNAVVSTGSFRRRLPVAA